MRFEPILFTTIKDPLLFSARGCLFGRFDPQEKGKRKINISGIFETKDGRKFPALIKKTTWRNLTRREDYEPDNQYYWRVYIRTKASGEITEIILIRIININFPIPIDASGELLTDYDDLFMIRGRLQEIETGLLVVRVEKNKVELEEKKEEKLFDFFDIIMEGNIPVEADYQDFWEIIASREGDYLRFKRGQLIEKSNSKKQKEIPTSLSREKAEDSVVLLTEEIATAWEHKEAPSRQTTQVKLVKLKKKEPLLLSENNNQIPGSIEGTTIMLNGRQAEITVKFTERPDLPEQGKKVTLEITGENGIVLKAEVNRKTLAKQVQKMDTFAEWVAALSGKISEITTEGMVILEGGNVQVFEKKQKAKPQEKEPQKADSVA